MPQDVSYSALLVMDMQSAILRNLPEPEPFIKTVARAMDAARTFGVPVIFVRVGFRPGAPEVSAHNKSFSSPGFRERWQSQNAEDFLRLHPDIVPRAQEVIVTKRRISAFTGSDLEVVLRAQEIQHLILCGISTSGVVLSTLREAADKDFRITVLQDCCADADPEVQRVLMQKIFPRQAEVTDSGHFFPES